MKNKYIKAIKFTHLAITKLDFNRSKTIVKTKSATPLFENATLVSNLLFFSFKSACQLSFLR